MTVKRDHANIWLGLQSLEQRQLMSAAPQFAVALSNQTFNTGGMLSIPVDGFDTDGDALTITATSDQAGLTTYIPRGNSFARLVFTESDGVTPIGEIILELFEQRSPTASQRFIDLSTNEVLAGGVLDPNGTPFWTDVVVHRIAHFGDDTPFVLQTGDATNANGTGDSPLPDFRGEHHEQLTFTGEGMVAFANTSLTTNNSQFFITAVGVNGLDGLHPIAGQMISGQAVYDNIMGRARDGSDRPLDPPLLKEVQIIESPQDATITFIPTNDFRGTANVTVTLDDGTGNITEQTISVNVIGINNPGPQQSAPGQTDTFNVDINAPGSTFVVGSVLSNASVDASGLVTVNTPAGFVGGYRVNIQADTPDSFSDVRADANPIKSVGVFSQDAGDPQGLGFLPTRLGELSFSVTWDGDLAYVALGTGGFEIYDASDPAAPIKLGSFDFDFAQARQIAIHGDVAYIAGTSGGLVAMDISDPSQPSIIDTLTTSGLAVDLQIVGNTAYIADFSNGLVAIDISDPDNMTVRDTLNTHASGALNGAVGLTILDDIAYVTNQTGGTVDSINIADPDNLAFVHRITGLSSPFGITGADNVLYIAASNGVAQLDVNATGTFLGGQLLPLANGAFQLELISDLLVVASGSDFILYDVSSSVPVVQHVFDTGVEATRPSFNQHTLALPAGSGGVFLLDVSTLIDVVPPSVQAFVKNDGADQRSLLTKLAYTFTEDVTVEADALVLENVTSGQMIDPLDMAFAFDTDTNTATWTFPNLEGGSLPNGNYIATLRATHVTDTAGLTLDADGDGVEGDDHIDTPFRLSGDADGDRDVDAADLFKFRGAFQTGPGNPNYNPVFDFEADGDVDSADLFKFRSVFQTQLPPESQAMPLASFGQGASQSSSATDNDVIDLGILSAFQQFNDQVNSVPSVKTYQFNVLAQANFSATLRSTSGNANFQLFDSDFNLIASSTLDGLFDDQLSEVLNAGTYFLEITAADGTSADYELTLEVN